MDARKPAVAGQFYAGSAKACVLEAKRCIDDWHVDVDLPGHIAGGIVPHAGWVFSGDLAGAVFSAIKKADGDVDTFVIFGAVHSYFGKHAAVYDRGSWQTPMGEVAIDENLAAEIVKIDCARGDRDAHIAEHSIEVQVPLIQHLFPDAKIVPIMVPPADYSIELGREIGDIIAGIENKTVVCIASTDLTHYGPRYGFTPVGAGPEGIEWARNVNDMEFINLALQMDPRRLLVRAEENGNACGPGAAAALITAAGKLGKTEGVLIGHTHSEDVMQRKFHQSSAESVGYAGIVY